MANGAPNGGETTILGAITKVGVWAVIVLYLLGAFDGFPGIKSPVARIVESNERVAAALTAALREHEASQERRDNQSEDTRRQLVDTMNALLRQLTMQDTDLHRRR